MKFYFVNWGDAIGHPEAATYNELHIRISDGRLFAVRVSSWIDIRMRPEWLTNEVCDRIGMALARSDDLPQSWGVFHDAPTVHAPCKDVNRD